MFLRKLNSNQCPCEQPTDRCNLRARFLWLQSFYRRSLKKVLEFTISVTHDHKYQEKGPIQLSGVHWFVCIFSFVWVCKSCKASGPIFALCCMIDTFDNVAVGVSPDDIILLCPNTDYTTMSSLMLHTWNCGVDPSHNVVCLICQQNQMQQTWVRGSAETSLICVLHLPTKASWLSDSAQK